MRAALTYEVTADALVCGAKMGKPDRHIAWHDVTDATVVETSVLNGLRLRRIDLVHGTDKERLSISCSTLYGGPKPWGDAAEHLALLAQIADQLGAVQAGFEISWGEYGKGRLAMFVVGVLTVVAAVAFAVLALMTGVSQSRLWDAAVPFTVMLVFGASLVFGNQPWRRVPKIDARVMAEILRQSAGIPAV